MESSIVPSDNTEVEPPDEVQNVFGRENDNRTEITSTTNSKQLPQNRINDLENNGLYEILTKIDPSFLKHDNVELTKGTRDMGIMELLSELIKNKYSMTSEDEENSDIESGEVSSLDSEDEAILRAMIESTINDPNKTLPEGSSTSVNEEDVRCESRSDNPTKDSVEALPQQNPTNTGCDESICDLPTRRSSRANSLEKEDITINDNNCLSKQSIFKPQNEAICAEDLPCSSSTENHTVNNAENTNEGDEQCSDTFQLITQAIQSVRKTLIDSNIDESSHPFFEHSQENNTVGSSSDQECNIDNLITLLKKFKDRLSDTESQQKIEQTCTSTDTQEESTICLEKGLRQKKVKKGHNKIERSMSKSQGDNETNVLRKPDCPGDVQVTSTVPLSEEVNDIEKDLVTLKMDLYNLRKSVKHSNIKRERLNADVHFGQVRPNVKSEKRIPRNFPVYFNRGANESVWPFGTAQVKKNQEKIFNAKQSPVEGSNVHDRQSSKSKYDCREADAPMNDINGPFFIDRNRVPVSGYYEGLFEKRWNPTRVLYEIVSQCRWGRPHFTQLNYSKDGGFLFSVKIKNCVFVPMKRGWPDKEAKHQASTHFLNFLGFKFIYNTPKRNSLEGSNSEIKYMTRSEMWMQQLVDEGKVFPNLHRPYPVYSAGMFKYNKGYNPNISRSYQQYSKPNISDSYKSDQSNKEYNKDVDRKSYTELGHLHFVRQNTERIPKNHNLISLKRKHSSSSNRSSQSERSLHKSHSHSTTSHDSVTYVPKKIRHDNISDRRSRSQSPRSHMRHRSSSMSKRRQHESRYESYKKEQKCTCGKHYSGSRE